MRKKKFKEILILCKLNQVNQKKAYIKDNSKDVQEILNV